MATTSILLGGTAGLNVLSGLFNMNAADDEAAALKTQAALARSESDADAERYALTTERFKASQKVAFLKSGVELTGSPLDVLDETARVSRENISAIKAQGATKEQALRSQASKTKNAGRAAFIQGLSSAAMTYARYAPLANPTEAVAKKGPATGTMYSKSARLNLITGF